MLFWNIFFRKSSGSKSDETGSYLPDLARFSAFGLSDDVLNQKLIDAGVGLNRGTQFGKQGSGYMRINIGCPKSILQEALFQIKKAFQED